MGDYQGSDGTERDGERMGSVLNAKITETEQVGMTRALSTASSLADLIEYENPGILDITALAETERPVHEYEQQLRSSRPAFLSFLKGLGLDKVSDRQKVANGLSTLLREGSLSKTVPAATKRMGVGLSEVDQQLLAELSKTAPTGELVLPPRAPPHSAPTVVAPGDPHLWFTPFNWHVAEDLLGGEPGAVAVSPGAYFRIEWEGEFASPIVLVLDLEAGPCAYLTLASSLNDSDLVTVQPPHGDPHTHVELPGMSLSTHTIKGEVTRYRLQVRLIP